MVDDNGVKRSVPVVVAFAEKMRKNILKKIFLFKN